MGVRSGPRRGIVAVVVAVASTTSTAAVATRAYVECSRCHVDVAGVARRCVAGDE